MLKLSKIRALAKLVDLPKYIKKNPNAVEDMEALEDEYFEGYYAQDAEDLADDLIQPGATGVGYVDDAGKLKGHIYGYDLIREDNLEDVDLNNLQCYSGECESPDFVDNLYRAADDGKILYVANFIVAAESRMRIKEILMEASNMLNGTQYEYLAFEALPDTMRLLFNKEGGPKTERLDSFGIEVVAVLPIDERNMVLLKRTEGVKSPIFNLKKIRNKMRGII